MKSRTRIVHPVGRESHLPYLAGVMDAADLAGIDVAVVVWNKAILSDVRSIVPAASCHIAPLNKIVTDWLRHLEERVTTVGRVDDDILPTPGLLAGLDLAGHDAVCAWPYSDPVPDYTTAVTMGGVHLARRDAITFRYARSFPAWSAHVDARWQTRYQLRDEPTTMTSQRPAAVVEAEMRRPRRHPWPSP